jgi:soluble lytic murein transglycosylase
MRAEAIFRIALAKMSRGLWQDAKPLLDRVLEIAPDDRFYATAGRALYFRGRAAAMTGDVEGARARYRRVVETYPLGFYMLLAHARLAADDAAGTKRFLEETIARDKVGAAPSRPHEIFASSAFLRAVRLLEVGEIDAARREVTVSGALAESADPEIVWTVGALYNKAGIPEIGHAVMRGKLAEYNTHYPEGKWRAAWEVAYPRAYESFVDKACEKNSLPRPVAWGIMREESNFWAEAKSPSNAYGLMQLIIPTAKWVSAGTGFGSDETSLKKPEVSIELGTRLLAQLRQRHGHPVLAIAAYNAGSGASDRWVKAPLSTDLDLFVDLIPYEETRNYVKRVLGTQTAYAYLYDNAVLSESLALPLGFAH